MTSNEPALRGTHIARDLRNARGLQNCLPTRCALRTARLRRDTGLKSGTRNRRKILEPVRRLFRVAPRMSREGEGRGRKISLERWTPRRSSPAISRRMLTREDVIWILLRELHGNDIMEGSRREINELSRRIQTWLVGHVLKMTFHVYRKYARW